MIVAVCLYRRRPPAGGCTFPLSPAASLQYGTANDLCLLPEMTECRLIAGERVLSHFALHSLVPAVVYQPSFEPPKKPFRAGADYLRSNDHAPNGPCPMAHPRDSQSPLSKPTERKNQTSNDRWLPKTRTRRRPRSAVQIPNPIKEVDTTKKRDRNDRPVQENPNENRRANTAAAPKGSPGADEQESKFCQETGLKRRAAEITDWQKSLCTTLNARPRLPLAAPGRRRGTTTCSADEYVRSKRAEVRNHRFPCGSKPLEQLDRLKNPATAAIDDGAVRSISSRSATAS